MPEIANALDHQMLFILIELVTNQRLRLKFEYEQCRALHKSYASEL